MLWLRSCPRCSGDLSEHTDIYGNEVICVQCGYYLTMSEENRLRRTHGRAAEARRWRAGRKKAASRVKVPVVGRTLKRRAS